MTAHDDDDRDRQRRYDRLAARIRACRRCEGMNILGETQAAPRDHIKVRPHRQPALAVLGVSRKRSADACQDERDVLKSV
jgi:hypothetical protein